MASAHSLAPSPSLHKFAPLHASGSPLYTVLLTVSVVLLLLCALGMHFLIKYALKCSRCTDMDLEGEIDSQMLGKKQANVSKVELKSLPVAVYKTEASKLPWLASSAMKEKTTQCAICLSNFKDGEKMRVLPQCSHEFHVACIDAWLCNHPNCPTCRQELTNQAAASRCDYSSLRYCQY